MRDILPGIFSGGMEKDMWEANIRISDGTQTLVTAGVRILDMWMANPVMVESKQGWIRSSNAMGTIWKGPSSPLKCSSKGDATDKLDVRTRSSVPQSTLLMVMGQRNWSLGYLIEFRQSHDSYQLMIFDDSTKVPVKMHVAPKLRIQHVGHLNKSVFVYSESCLVIIKKLPPNVCKRT